MPRKKNRRERRGRPSVLSRLTIDQIKAEMTRRQEVLLTRRSETERELVAIDGELAHLGSVDGQFRNPSLGEPRRTGGPKAKRRGRGGKGRGRGGNEKSLPALLHSLLQGRTMSVADMAAAAKKA